MRYVWLVFVGLLVAMALVLPRLNRSAQAPRQALWSSSKPKEEPEQPVSSFASLREAPAAGAGARADSIVAFGLAQQGTPYVYAGISPLTGFDCSGFIMYTFAHFGVAVPHSTALLIDVGRPVGRAEAQQGDIVVFTGTASTSATPGHAGIVISRRGEVPLRFVHASSDRRVPGVKISHVEGTDYERRFMQVRRVLGAGEAATARRPQPTATPRAAQAVAALPARAVKVEPELLPAATLPRVLATRKHPASSTHKATARVSKRKTASRPAIKKVVAARKKVTAPKKAATPARKRKAPAQALRPKSRSRK